DSYKRLKEISIMHSLFDPLTDEELKAKKKMEIAEIGILTLTIDSSLSELTSKKLKNFSKDIILDIIKDLKDADLTADTSEYNSRGIPENRSIESNLKTSENCKNIDTTANTSKSNSRTNGNVISKNRKRKSSLKSSAKHKSTGLSEKCETFSKKFMERNPNFLNR
ncbi:uncharacterized protein LOC118179404, partial [Stegodyphus dumicola]|uniref:uncharacterized protein LOC118179404 n=1 Tax=Stegodyphus dumicola TaxID=202533 RepID=UPI0015A7CECA